MPPKPAPINPYEPPSPPRKGLAQLPRLMLWQWLGITGLLLGGLIGLQALLAHPVTNVAPSLPSLLLFLRVSAAWRLCV